MTSSVSPNASELVFICSPFSGGPPLYRKYLLEAIRDSLSRGENPFAPHYYYTRFLDDNDLSQRNLGRVFGQQVLARCDSLVVYADHGITPGMNDDIQFAVKARKNVTVRYLRGGLKGGKDYTDRESVVGRTEGDGEAHRASDV
jgi:hypothetical protein